MGTEDEGLGSDPPEAGTSDRLVRAAFELFAEVGVERARVQDIAERAGYTTGAIYSRFENKAALLSAAIAQHGSSFLEGTLRDVAADPEGTGFEALAVASQVGPTVTMHRVLVDVFAIALRDDQVHAALVTLVEEIREAFLLAATSRAEHGAIDPEVPAEAVAHLAITLMLGSFVSKALGVEQPDPEAARQLAARLVEGLGP